MTLHDDARRVLADWRAPDAAQESLREQYLAHLASHPDAMWRSCHPDHLTASAIVLSDDARHVGLTLHRKLGRWLQFGGHCERDDATLAGAARRETREESGIAEFDLDPQPLLLSRHEVPCGPVRPAHHLDVQYLAVVPSGTELIVSEESTDVRWFSVEDLPAETDDTVRALTATARTRLRESPRPAPGARTR
ncbi:NUDIX domain-containing protein [Aeromicrobium phragmitis]|uniref:NUDIX domain-containing protein n=1 Tax=Aeromicrobium phragmitis TaxID=2478914 RepID=A0A3L8PHH8_9ACTN|nr:NUDIX domain-containing protein [Aeromicrobium phragmitis]RLV54685.1 NUDIX domain-containing protein [Aeromicrobium phragmitis]